MAGGRLGYNPLLVGARVREGSVETNKESKNKQRALGVQSAGCVFPLAATYVPRAGAGQGESVGVDGVREAPGVGPLGRGRGAGGTAAGGGGGRGVAAQLRYAAGVFGWATWVK